MSWMLALVLVADAAQVPPAAANQADQGVSSNQEHQPGQGGTGTRDHRKQFCFDDLSFRVQWLNSTTARLIATTKKLDCNESSIRVQLIRRPQNPDQEPRHRNAERLAGGGNGGREVVPVTYRIAPQLTATASPQEDPKDGPIVTIHVRKLNDGGGEGHARLEFTPIQLLDEGGRVGIKYEQVNAVDDARELREVYDEVAVLDPHRLRFDGGIAMVMGGDGSFQSRPELALNSTSRWFGALGGVVDLRYVNANTDTGSPALKTPGMFEATVRALLYPLDREQWKIPAFAVVGGLGVRSKVENAQITATSSVLGGLRFNVLSYNPTDTGEDAIFAGSRSFVELGYAWDKNWQHENRFYGDGQLEVPGLKTKWVHFMVRAHFDRPAFQHGPIDLRISALASIDPKALTGFFGMPDQ